MVASMPVFLAAELGIFVSLLILLPLAFRQRRGPWKTDGKTHLALLLQALFGIVLYRAFIFRGLRHTTAAAGGLISSAAPALIALLAFVLLRERISGKRVIGAISVSIGILAVNLHPFLNDASQAADAILGNCLILAAVLCESGFSVMSRAKCGQLTALRRTALISLYAFLCLLPCAVYEAREYDFAAMPFSTALCIGYYGIFVSFLSYVFWFKGIAVVPAGIAVFLAGLGCGWFAGRPVTPAAALEQSYRLLDRELSRNGELKQRDLNEYAAMMHTLADMQRRLLEKSDD